MSDTESAESRDDRAPLAGAWWLCLAVECARPRAQPERISLAGFDEVEIGRGTARTMRADGTKLKVTLADAAASESHAKLTRQGSTWAVEDFGSKNGTRVAGKPVDRAELADGNVLELGATFFVMRRALRSAPSVEPEASRTLPALRTFSPALERELAPLGKIARSKVPVLVRGESGTGKELIAQAVHRLSERAGPFVPVNCGAIPAALFESELFGSRRGAFSGAEDRAGLVRSAERGTLFLDEIADLPASSQAALLRFLQEGEVLALGGGRPSKVDVRVVTATHRAVEELVRRDAFRRDLHARLRGYEVRLPALRERLEDLGLLIGTLLDRHSAARDLRFSLAAMRALFEHHWPFNVRELEQAVHTAVTVASGPEVKLEDLKLAPPDAPPAPASQGERERLEELLKKHAGNLSAVARELETSRTQVQRRLAHHGLDIEVFRGGSPRS